MSSSQLLSQSPGEVEELRRLVRQQYDSLSNQAEELKNHKFLLKQKDDELQIARERIEQLEEFKRLAQTKRFGSSSEKLEGLQEGLFNEAEALAPEQSSLSGTTEEDELIEVAAHKKKKRGHRKPLPDFLERIERVVELPEDERHCPYDGTRLEPMGEDVSERLDVIPEQVRVIRTHRVKYACPCCEAIRVKAAEPAIVPKGLPTEGTLASIIGWKFINHLPLYRIESMFERLGVEVSRGTLARWVVACGQAVQPLVNLMSEKILSSGYVQADETRVQVLDEPGKSATSRSYMWVRRALVEGKPLVLFDYAPTRSGEVPRKLFEGFQGFLQIDGYDGYNTVTSQPGVTRVGCFAHARRKFDEAKKAASNKKGLAHEALVLMARLFALEKHMAAFSPEDRLKGRAEGALPILAELRAFIDRHRPSVPKEGLLGKAFTYIHNEWEYLAAYVQDGRLEISNNFCENVIRPFAVGRKNWLFAQSVAGAEASANLYSLVITAKECGLDVHAYLRFVFERIPKASTVDDFEALLPQNAPESCHSR